MTGKVPTILLNHKVTKTSDCVVTIGGNTGRHDCGSVFVELQQGILDCHCGTDQGSCWGGVEVCWR
jgi:hypothetical protein